jgi:5-carboxymethyl-2-hydroxymuconate isomerase
MTSSQTEVRPEDRLIQALGKGRRPRLLYHYSSGSALLGILESRSIWATNIRFLNDSTEYRFALEMAKSLVANRKENTRNRITAGLYEVLKDRLTSEFQKEVFVSSFSERPDQLSQWRAYCLPHGGYAIGFRSKEIVNSRNSSATGWLVRCRYDEESQLSLIEELFKVVEEYAEENRALASDRVYRESYKLVGRLLPLVAPALKDPSFAEEQEWRLVRSAESFDGFPLFRSALSMLVPYHEHQLAAPGESLPIEEVIVGPTPHPKLAIEGVGGLLASHRLSETKTKPSS